MTTETKSPTCSFEGCQRVTERSSFRGPEATYRADGLCKRHAQQIRDGSPLSPIPYGNTHTSRWRSMRLSAAPETPVASDCVHHWIVTAAYGEEQPARCKLCGAQRVFRPYEGEDERLRMTKQPGPRRMAVLG